MKFPKKYFSFIYKYNYLLSIYILLTWIGITGSVINGKINTYLIYTRVFDIFIKHGNIYDAHPDIFSDYYRYTPTFAILLSPFSLISDYIGPFLWTGLNAFILCEGVRKLVKNEKNACIALWIILVEFETSILGWQINGLVAGLILLSFAWARENKEMKFALAGICNFFIKIYGGVSLLFTLLYPGERKRFIWIISFFILFLFLPLLFISFPELCNLYRSEFASIISYKTDLSIMEMFRAWFKIDFPNLPLQIIASVIFILPMLLDETYKNENIKILFLCSSLIFIVLFNQLAESQTYVIAVAGFAVYWVLSPKSKINNVLLILVFLFTILSHTDFYPWNFRENFICPSRIKAFPMLLAWIKIQYDTWKMIKMGGFRIVKLRYVL